MHDDFQGIVAAFPGLQVLVLGEAMLDCYWQGTSQRLCPEAPVPVVDISSRMEAPGGAANVAVNATSLGAAVSFLSVIGADYEGAIVRRVLRERGLSTDHLLACSNRRTLAKQRILAGAQLVCRFDQGDTCPLEENNQQALIERLRDLWRTCDAVIVSDYGYGILTPQVVAVLAELQAAAPRIVVADSKCLAAYRAVGVTAVKPNFQEALRLLGRNAGHEGPSRIQAIQAHGPEILNATGARIAAVTLDADGALIFEGDRPVYRTYARPHPQVRAAGAGDTFSSALALALAAGADAPTAAELASAAAAVVVAQEGTACCPLRALRAQLAGGHKLAPDAATLSERLDDERRQGRRIVFTNGCFDILHRGHVAYLSRAKAQGDILVVGVNSDESIRRLKGPHRPINALEDRLQVLAALSCVDHLIAFDEDTPHNLIQAVRPAVFVKGGDYTRERLPEAALVENLGGVVKILPLTDKRSTTALIERIGAVVARGATRVARKTWKRARPAEMSAASGNAKVAP